MGVLLAAERNLKKRRGSRQEFQLRRSAEKRTRSAQTLFALLHPSRQTGALSSIAAAVRVAA